MPASTLLHHNNDADSITIWLETHPEHPEEYFCETQLKPYQDESKPHPVLRESWLESPNKRRKLGEISDRTMNARSERTRRTSPRKDGRVAQDRPSASQQIEEDATTLNVRQELPSTPPGPAAHPLILDQDRTPKPLSLTTTPLPDLSYTILGPPRPSDSRSDASSPTRSTTSSSRANSTRSAPRARSPVKRIGDFHLSSVPITLRDFSTPSYPLSASAKPLTRDLRRISAGRSIIPTQMRDCAMPYLEDIIFDDLCFADPDSNFDTDPNIHEDLWHQVLLILDAARECRTQHLPEASWNAEVHSRLLRAALSGHWHASGVWYRDITTAKISDPSLLPTAYAGSSSSAIMQSKMVDYALIIDPDSSLGDKIAQTLRSEGGSSINQTSAEHVRFAPICVSFETKRAAVDEDEGCVQLGVWVVAHFARLRQLVRNRGAANSRLNGESGVQLPVLPLVMCQGHDWKMMVAEAVVEPGEDDFKVIILRDLRLGSTDTVLGIYQLVESVRRLAKWVEEEYRPWLEKEALLGGDWVS